MKDELRFYQWLWKEYKISSKNFEDLSLTEQEVYKLEYEVEFE